MSDESLIAVFVDYENLAIGVRDAKMGRFRMDLVLKRLLEKGRIVYKRAYCDWGRFRDYKNDFQEASIELIDIPKKRISGKNSADIRMVVDALDLCYTKDHIDTFVIISGDSDFSPLVSKLRENAKTVIGVGVKNSTSDLLMSNCDEFILYDDLVRTGEPAPARKRRRPSPKAAKAAPAQAVETPPAAADDRAQKGIELVSRPITCRYEGVTYRRN